MLGNFSIQAQQIEKQFSLNWTSGSKHFPLVSNTKINIPNFDDIALSYENNTVVYTKKWQTSLTVLRDYSIENVVFESLSANELYDLDKNKLPVDFTLDFALSKARNIAYLVLKINTIIYKDGAIKKLKSFQIRYANSGGSTQSPSGINTIINSVYDSETLYKFKINQSGVYKIDKGFLEQLGINTSNINPQHIKVYGNGGLMLPLKNSTSRPIDLEENAIQVIGESDGRFENSDYILFYAQGANGWNSDSNTFVHIYDPNTYYYISTGGALGKRIQAQNQPTGTAIRTIVDFDEVQYHELSLFNLVNTGRRWFGELFDIETTQTFDFTFENLVVSQDLTITVSAAAASLTPSQMQVSVNGQNHTAINLSASNHLNGIYATGNNMQDTFTSTTDAIQVELNYDKMGNPSAKGYLDYIKLKGTRELKATTYQMLFYKEDVASQLGIAQYAITNADAITTIWDITDLYNVSSLANLETTGTNYSFKANMGELRKYIAVHNNDFYSPEIDQNPNVAQQNLHKTVFLDETGSFQDVDYLIITKNDSRFTIPAEKLAQYRRDNDGLNVKVITLDKIYNEFSGGKKDVAAIRDFVKYVYDNASSPANKLKYLCLFGDASYDYQGIQIQTGNTNDVPLFESYESFSLITSYASDDFFGLLDPNEGLLHANEMLDLAVGRILAETPADYGMQVDKILSYENLNAYGSWRNSITMVADDVDVSSEAILQTSVDNLAQTIATQKPFFNLKKIYSDAYLQESSAGGFRYPAVNEALNNSVEKGTLIVNYFGHGGENGWAHERILEINQIKNWYNPKALHMMITITCQFTKFDNPERNTAGEYVFWNKHGAAASLITTTREIYIGFGASFNQILSKHLLNYNSNTNYFSNGEALRLAKNEASSNQRRLIFLIGDPTQYLAIAKPKVNLTKINGIPISGATETLTALSHVTMEGNVTDEAGNLLSGMNGIVYPTVFDKKIQRSTLGNDGQTDSSSSLIVMDFETLGETIFRGQATITNGVFAFDFVVPRDILIPVDAGRVSFYAKENGVKKDYTGYSHNLQVGGVNANPVVDNEGPIIHLYMNDLDFVNGEITNDSPILIAILEDDNGINTTGGIGHDIIAILDGDETNPYILNDYYQADINTYQRGELSFPFHNLEPGLHTIRLTAWDTFDNVSSAEIQFVVISNAELEITRMLNYPNPFVDYTEFWFEHNHPFEPLEVSVQVYTVAGKLVWSTHQTIITEGFVSRDIFWDGKDDFGQKIGKGVYLYKISVNATLSNKKVEKFEKLVLL
jgi:hypothetical protein